MTAVVHLIHHSPSRRWRTGKALSRDLRWWVVRASKESLSARRAAAQFGISVSSAIRWIVWARIGELAPRPQGRRRSSNLDGHDVFIVGLIEERTEITLNEMVEQRVRERSVRISLSASSDWLCRRGWTFKKGRTGTGAGPLRHPEASQRLARRPTGSRSGKAGTGPQPCRRTGCAARPRPGDRYRDLRPWSLKQRRFVRPAWWKWPHENLTARRDRSQMAQDTVIVRVTRRVA